MDEMTAGIEQISAAVNQANGISLTNSDGIAALMREVARFEVD
jgi:hypothetical protein